MWGIMWTQLLGLVQVLVLALALARQMERPLWTAGCSCGGDRPAGRGGRWAAGWGACTGTVYQHPAEETTQLAC